MKAVLLALFFYCASASAQAIKDPTRPPPGLGAVQPSTGMQAAPAGPVLQSVILSPTRRAAIISGQLVERGEPYGEAVLAEVGQDYVVLRSGAGTQVLKLYPGTEKRAAGKAPRQP
jgi:MSHA biogenesis protein MshK